MTTPAGWYPDPQQPTTQRYWDGQQWTDRTTTSVAGAGLSNFARSEENVTRAIEAVLWRHSRTDPLSAKSRCSGGEPRCAFPMDADAFYHHQSKAVFDEVFVPEFRTFVEQTHLATQTVERVAEIVATASPSGTRWLGKMGGVVTPNAKPKPHWWSSSLVGWVITFAIGAFFLASVLKSCGA